MAENSHNVTNLGVAAVQTGREGGLKIDVAATSWTKTYALKERRFIGSERFPPVGYLCAEVGELSVKNLPLGCVDLTQSLSEFLPPRLAGVVLYDGCSVMSLPRSQPS